MKRKCCICLKEIDDEYGHNPYPVKEEGRCCTECNKTRVIPARLREDIIWRKRK